MACTNTFTFVYYFYMDSGLESLEISGKTKHCGDGGSVPRPRMVVRCSFRSADHPTRWSMGDGKRGLKRLFGQVPVWETGWEPL